MFIFEMIFGTIETYRKEERKKDDNDVDVL